MPTHVELAWAGLLAGAVAALLHARRRRLAHPPAALVKLSTAGEYQHFPGVTVVWHLSGTCPREPLQPSLRHQPSSHRPSAPDLPWISLAGRLNDLLEPASFVPLPAHSYHVTLLDVITMKRALGAGSSADEWAAYLHARAPRLRRAAELLAREPFVPMLRLKEVQVHAGVVGAELELASAEAPRATALERDLVRTLGLDAGRRWPFHLTLAYRRPAAPGAGAGAELSEGTVRAVAAAVASCCGRAPIPLDAPRLCAFDDMTLFAPWCPAQSTATSDDADVDAAPPLLRIC